MGREAEISWKGMCMHKLMPVAALALLVGCTATYPYTRKPADEIQAWTRDVHECKLVAREGFVFGSALFVMAEYNTRWKVCMVHRGWFIPRPKEVA